MRTSGEGDCRFDCVLELADIAGPRMLQQCLHRIGVDLGYGCRRDRPVPLQEVSRQERDVFLALAERRKLQTNHVQPVEKVLAEPAGIDFVFKTLMGCGDDAHVYLD